MLQYSAGVEVQYRVWFYRGGFFVVGAFIFVLF